MILLWKVVNMPFIIIQLLPKSIMNHFIITDPIPNPQPPIPSPQSPIPNPHLSIINSFYSFDIPSILFKFMLIV